MFELKFEKVVQSDSEDGNPADDTSFFGDGQLHLL